MDTASYQFNTGPVSVTLGLNGANGRAEETASPGQPVVSVDTLQSIENVVGSAFNDSWAAAGKTGRTETISPVRKVRRLIR